MSGYHWVLTIQFLPGEVPTVSTYGAGTIVPAAGQTRGQVFAQLYDRLLAQAQTEPRLRGISLDNPIVTFFSLERDEL